MSCGVRYFAMNALSLSMVLWNLRARREQSRTIGTARNNQAARTKAKVTVVHALVCVGTERRRDVEHVPDDVGEHERAGEHANGGHNPLAVRLCRLYNEHDATLSADTPTFSQQRALPHPLDGNTSARNAQQRSPLRERRTVSPYPTVEMVCTDHSSAAKYRDVGSWMSALYAYSCTQLYASVSNASPCRSSTMRHRHAICKEGGTEGSTVHSSATVD